MTPGQAAWSVWMDVDLASAIAWEDKSPDEREDWERIAQAAIEAGAGEFPEDGTASEPSEWALGIERSLRLRDIQGHGYTSDAERRHALALDAARALGRSEATAENAMLVEGLYDAHAKHAAEVEAVNKAGQESMKKRFADEIMRVRDEKGAGLDASYFARCGMALPILSAAAKSTEDCRSCAIRKRAGLDGQCYDCANERTRAALRAERAAKPGDNK